MSTQQAVGSNWFRAPAAALLEPRAPLGHDVEEALDLDADLFDVGRLEAAGREVTGDEVGVDRHRAHVANVAGGLEGLRKFKAKDPGMAKIFSDAVGYVVFPTVGKGGIGLGGARGKGWVYEGGHIIGKSTLTQVSFGFQFGGQAYSEIVFFQTAQAMENFKLGHLKFDAQASAVARNGVAIVTMAKGGLMYEASVGGQKFSFKPVGKK